jgi:hypothetical protein
MAGAVLAALVATTGVAPAREPQRGCPAVRRLTDEGAWTFTRLPSMSPPPSGLESSPIDSYAVDPTDSRIIYVADSFTVMRSTDEGCHWVKSFSLLDAPGALPNDHLVSLSAVTDKRGETGLVGLVRRGPWPYADRNTGGTGYDVTSSLLTGNGTDEWTLSPITDEHGLPVYGLAEHLWIAPGAPASMYLTVTTHITVDLYGSEDGGATWERRVTSVAPGLGDVTCGPADVCTAVAPWNLAIDPRDPRHLFSRGEEVIIESPDGGRSWEPIQRFPEQEFGRLQGVEVYAHGDGSLRVAAIGSFAWLISEDGGKSWTPEEPAPTRSLTGPVDHTLDSWATGRRGDMVVAAQMGQTLLRRKGRWIDVSLPSWGCLASIDGDFERRHVCLGRLQYATGSRTYFFLSKTYSDGGPDGRYLVELTLAPR